MVPTNSKNSKNQKTVIVTGGCGFIGSHFIRLLFERLEYRIVNIDKLTYAGNLENLAELEATRDPLRYRLVRADIADAQAMSEVFASEPIGAVINLAAESHVDRSLMDSAPFIKTNVEGTRVLLDLAVKHGVQRFLQVSTDEVYGSLTNGEPPFTEESALRPNSPYAASKAAADLLARSYHQSYGLPVLITRCGNNYGPYQFPEKFLPLFITNTMDGQPLPLYGDGQNVRDWIHVGDHVRGLLRVVESGDPGEVYNIGAEMQQTNQGMAEQILDILNKPRSLIRYVKDRPGHDFRYALDVTKAKNKLGWKPLISLEEGLRATVAWYKGHCDWWGRIKAGEYRHYYASWYGGRVDGV